MKRHISNSMKTIFLALASMMAAAFPVATHAKGYALWCYSAKTLYFVEAGSQPYTFGGSQVTEAWEITDKNISGGVAAPIWIRTGVNGNVDVVNYVETVVFDTSFRKVKPSGLYGWFHGCKYLTTVIGLSNINMERVGYTNKMFYGCSSLETLNFMGVDMSKVVNTTMMFYGCTALKTIYSDKAWSVPHSAYMFSECNQLKGAVEYQEAAIDGAMANPDSGYFIGGRFVYALLSDGVLRFLVSPVELHVGDTYEGGEIESLYNGDDFLTITDGNLPWSTDQTVTIDGSFSDVPLITLKGWFRYRSRLTTINGLENLNTTNVSSINGMFEECRSLQRIDLSGMDLSNITDVANLFNGCSSLEQVTMAERQLPKVTTMEYVFANCQVLPSVDLSAFVTEEVTSMKGLFKGCYKLSSIDLSPLNTAMVESMEDMFRNCAKLQQLDVNTFDVGNVTHAENMFNGCNDLTTIFCDNTWNIANTHDMFLNCTSLKGAIRYDASKCDGEYANPETGYFYSELYPPEYDPDGRLNIRTVADWEKFAEMVNGGNTTLSAVMKKDVDLGERQVLVGTDDNPYSGEFDGNGHVLNINWTTTDVCYAPFYTVKDATIKNLHVTGTIMTSHYYTGGIIGVVSKGEKATTLSKCWSSVSIDSSDNTSHGHGGIIGTMDPNAKLNMDNCLFDGAIKGANATVCGGLIGLLFYQPDLVNINNTLVNPSEISFNTNPTLMGNRRYYSSPIYAFTGSPYNAYVRFDRTGYKVAFGFTDFGQYSNLIDMTEWSIGSIVSQLNYIYDNWTILDGKPVLKY